VGWGRDCRVGDETRREGGVHLRRSGGQDSQLQDDVEVCRLLQREFRMKLYVGNLSYEVTEEDLRLALEQFGQVESATIIKDKYSGQSKGFGFVEMSSKAEGQAAIDGLNGKELKGRTLNVNEARPRTDSRGGGGGYGGSRGGHGGGRGGPKGGRRF
jgi:cold-inducible RNA-binding protein